MSKMPQWMIVALALVGTVLFLYVANPPHTVCDSQAEVFKKTQIPFLFLDAKKSYITTTGIQRATDNCKRGNSHGACRELFDGLSKMILDIRVVPQQCLGKINEIKEVRTAIYGSIELFTLIAWGEKAPESAYSKQGWLDSAHVRTYCELKRWSQDLYGEDAWNAFANQMMTKLPQFNELGREQGWPRTLLSTNCKQYL